MKTQQSTQESVGVSLLTDYTLKMLECEWSLIRKRHSLPPRIGL